MKTAQEILTSLDGETIYVTTRGTMGDVEGMLTVDDDLIGDFADATVIKLSDGLGDFEDSSAYDDIINELDKHLDDKAKSNNYDGYYVIYKDNQYLLAWE